MADSEFKINPIGIQTMPLIKGDGSIPLAGLKSEDPKAVKQAATDFEALLVKQMLSAMWQTVPNGGAIERSHEQELYQEMFHDALAKNIAENGSMGIRDVIIKDINRIDAKNVNLYPNKK